MKRTAAIMGHLLFLFAGVAVLGYVWYVFIYCGEGSFIAGTRRAHFSGYYYPWRVFGLTTALFLPALVANLFRLLQLWMPSSKLLGQGKELRYVSEYSILIILLIFLSLLPEIDLVNDKAENVLWAPKTSKATKVNSRNAPAPTQQVLPWEKDYSSAVEKANKEGRPLFIMMTANWCGWCRKLEQDTFTDKRVRELLKPFVCVQVLENREVDKKYGTGGYPNLAFVKPNGEKAHGIGGYKPPIPFIRGIVNAYEALEMKLPEPYEEARKHFFELDIEKAAKLVEAGDVIALEQLLEPVNKDSFTERNYLIAQFELPDGINRNTLDVFSGYSYKSIPESGVVLLEFRPGDSDTSFSLVHRGCEPLHYRTNFSEKHLESKTFTVKRIPSPDKIERQRKASIDGLVGTIAGKPVEKAFLNVYDWQTIKTGKNGGFQMRDIASSTFTVCATARGYAAKPTVVTLEDQATRGLHIKMEPAETVHIRWAYQAEEGNPRFDSGDIVNGEYVINIKDSRFSLRRGHPLDNWGSDIMFRKKDDGKLYFHLFDGSGNNNGVLRSELRYNEIKAADPETHYTMRPDEAIEAGQCYLVRCCQGEHYAKLQVLDVCLKN